MTHPITDPRICDQLDRLAAYVRRLEHQRDALLEACRNLEDKASLVLADVCDQDTGWYYQFQASIQKTRAAIAAATREDGDS